MNYDSLPTGNASAPGIPIPGHRAVYFYHKELSAYIYFIHDHPYHNHHHDHHHHPHHLNLNLKLISAPKLDSRAALPRGAESQSKSCFSHRHQCHCHHHHHHQHHQHHHQTTIIMKTTISYDTVIIRKTLILIKSSSPHLPTPSQ